MLTSMLVNIMPWEYMPFHYTLFFYFVHRLLGKILNRHFIKNTHKKLLQIDINQLPLPPICILAYIS